MGDGTTWDWAEWARLVLIWVAASTAIQTGTRVLFGDEPAFVAQSLLFGAILGLWLGTVTYRGRLQRRRTGS